VYSCSVYISYVYMHLLYNVCVYIDDISIDVFIVSLLSYLLYPLDHSTYPPAGHALILRLARYVLLSDNAKPLQPQRCCYDDLHSTCPPPLPPHTSLPFSLPFFILINNLAPCAWLSSLFSPPHTLPLSLNHSSLGSLYPTSASFQPSTHF
jgi:hypothetical protein